VKITMNLLSKTHFHIIITIKFVPPNPRKDPPEPPRSVITTAVQPIVPYSKPCRRQLNYPKYKKDFDLDVHVQVFKATIKVDDETIDEEITNLFNFTLRDNTCN
jgi:hypothetical protein